MGPRPPPGPKHHYHLQVFALDTVLNPGSGHDLRHADGTDARSHLASAKWWALPWRIPNILAPAATAARTLIPDLIRINSAMNTPLRP